jgi:hypothetical protein
MTFSKTCIKGTWYVLQDGQILSHGLPSERAADRFIMFAEELRVEPVRRHIEDDAIGLDMMLLQGLRPDGQDGDDV